MSLVEVMARPLPCRCCSAKDGLAIVDAQVRGASIVVAVQLGKRPELSLQRAILQALGEVMNDVHQRLAIGLLETYVPSTDSALPDRCRLSRTMAN
jgi:hypothetical protein